MHQAVSLARWPLVSVVLLTLAGTTPLHAQGFSNYRPLDDTDSSSAGGHSIFPPVRERNIPTAQWEQPAMDPIPGTEQKPWADPVIQPYSNRDERFQDYMPYPMQDMGRYPTYDTDGYVQQPSYGYGSYQQPGSYDFQTGYGNSTAASSYSNPPTATSYPEPNSQPRRPFSGSGQNQRDPRFRPPELQGTP